MQNVYKHQTKMSTMNTGKTNTVSYTVTAETSSEPIHTVQLLRSHCKIQRILR